MTATAEAATLPPNPNLRAPKRALPRGTVDCHDLRRRAPDLAQTAWIGISNAWRA